MKQFQILLISCLSLAVAACGPTAGEAGEAGEAGADGADGTDGSTGTDGSDGSDADVTALQAELDALKTVVELNTAKVGYTDDLVTANAAVSASTTANAVQDALIGLNTAKTSITQAQTTAIAANTAKTGFPGFGTNVGTN